MQIGEKKETREFPQVKPFKLPKKISTDAPIPVSIPVKVPEKVGVDADPKRNWIENNKLG